MSCGPAQLLKDIAATTDQALDIADKAANLLPYGVATVTGFVEAQLIAQVNEQVALIKEFINNPLAAVGGLVPGLPAEIQGLIEQGKAFEEALGPAIDTVKGAAATALYVKNLKDKYSDVDVDIDNVVGLMEDLGNDLDLLCKLVPNIQDVGGELVVKGFPVSFPDISPGTILEEGKFPDILKNIEDAIKDVEVTFTPDPDKEGITVSEEPGAPFRVNGGKRDQRTRATFLDDLTGGQGLGGKGLFGELLDTVEGALDSVTGTLNELEETANNLGIDT